MVRSESVVGDGGYVNNKFRRYYTIWDEEDYAV